MGPQDSAGAARAAASQPPDVFARHPALEAVGEADAQPVLVALEEAHAQAGVDVVVEVECGQDQDPGAREFRRDLAGRGDSVDTWHADVHEDHIRVQTESPRPARSRRNSLAPGS